MPKDFENNPSPREPGRAAHPSRARETQPGGADYRRSPGPHRGGGAVPRGLTSPAMKKAAVTAAFFFGTRGTFCGGSGYLHAAPFLMSP